MAESLACRCRAIRSGMSGDGSQGTCTRHRRRLGQPRRVTDRAEVRYRTSDMIANRLQALQNRLPLFPVKLLQERPEPLDERILEERFSVGFRNEKPVQADVERLADLFQRAEAWCHLPALDAREVGTRHLAFGLQLALRHPAGFPQLADTLPYVLHRFLVGELIGRRFDSLNLLSRGRGDQELQSLRQCPHT